MRNCDSIYVFLFICVCLCAAVACSVRGTHNTEQQAVDSCAFRLGIISDSLSNEINEISDVNTILQTIIDSATARKDSILLAWVKGLDGLAEERLQLKQRADSLMAWSKNYLDALGAWHEAMQVDATHDSSLVKMDDEYTRRELSAQKRNCELLQSEIGKWRRDKSAFNTIYDSLSQRSLLILSPKFVVK